MGKRGAVATRARRTSGKAVAVSASALAPSPGMTQRARTVWKQLVGSWPVGHFTEADRHLLELYCEAVAQHRAAVAFLAKNGRYYTDEKGVNRKHPACEDEHQARCECSMLATKLRITKQATTSPKVAGRAALDASEAGLAADDFGGLLYSGDGVRQ